jgi:antitoxin PrlF
LVSPLLAITSAMRDQTRSDKLARGAAGLHAWTLGYYILDNVMEARLWNSAITTKGQATIPKAIRDHLGLKPGDRVKFFMHPDGSVVLLPKRPASVLRGIVKPRRRPATIEEMSKAAAAGAIADALPRRR